MTAAKAGFIYAFAQTISLNIQWLLTQVRNFEISAVSVERTMEYCELEQEGSAKSAHNDNQTSTNMSATFGGWPSAGRLDVEELSVRYGDDMPEILHKISFSVEGGGCKVGIVGASGGGKSTLAKALFHFVDISHGRILIDGKGMLGHTRQIWVRADQARHC